MILQSRNVEIADRLGGVSTLLNPREITAICGPNGAGKSTLLASFAGLLQPSSGEVTLEGKSLSDWQPVPRARHIGYLPQLGEVAWDVSVRNLVALGRLPHRDDGKDAVAAAISACELAEFVDRPVSTLSGGEKARALLARVLAGEPDWILADEPLAALDLAHQLRLLRVLRGQTERGRGVVLVLHDLPLAMNHADRVIVLDKGKLVADGVPEQSLGEGVIEQVWGVRAQWIGEPGKRALAL